jgi:hypothetical protein
MRSFAFASVGGAASLSTRRRPRQAPSPSDARLRVGLLRVARGQLLVMKAGAGLRDDPTRLWQHVAERLTGRPKDAFAHTATALVLVSAAGGRVDDEQLAAVLTSAGWSGRGGAGVHRYAVTSAAGHVDEVLDVVDAYSGRRSVTGASRVLARAALRSR